MVLRIKSRPTAIKIIGQSRIKWHHMPQDKIPKLLAKRIRPISITIKPFKKDFVFMETFS